MLPSDQETIDDLQLAVERGRRKARRVVDAEERLGHPPLKALALGELFDRPTPQYLIDQWIPEGALIQIVGPPPAA